jgi:hypothetical protein
MDREAPMFREAQEIAEKVDHDFMGRLIAYGGGGAGFTYTAIADYIQGASVADWAQWMFAASVLGRLVFDVVKEFIKSRKAE